MHKLDRILFAESFFPSKVILYGSQINKNVLCFTTSICSFK